MAYRDPKRKSEYGKNYYKRNYDKLHQARNSEDGKLIKRKNHLKKYGISVETFDKMLSEQNGVCAICLRPETATRNGKIRLLVIDHNHITHKVRRLLCNRCNTVLGFIDDDPLLAKALMDYLQHEKSS